MVKKPIAWNKSKDTWLVISYYSTTTEWSWVYYHTKPFRLVHAENKPALVEILKVSDLRITDLWALADETMFTITMP